MNEQNGKSKGTKKTVIYIIAAIIVIVLLAILFYPMFYKLRIKADLEADYEGVSISKIILFDSVKTLEQLKDETYEWLDDDFEDGKYKMFTFVDSHGNIAEGIATLSGEVVADSYGHMYYEDELIWLFKHVYEYDDSLSYPEYKVKQNELANRFRLVKTSQCGSFEEFLEAKIVCLNSSNSSDLISLEVGFVNPTEEMLNELVELLANKGFDMNVDMGKLEETKMDGKYYWLVVEPIVNYCPKG